MWFWIKLGDRIWFNSQGRDCLPVPDSKKLNKPLE